MTRRTMTGLVAAAPLVAALLTGCNADEVGAAAVVDGRRISVDALQKDVAAVREIAGTGQSVSAIQQSELRQMIMIRLVDRLAANQGIRVDDAQVNSVTAGAARGEGAFAQEIGQVQGARLPESQKRQLLRYFATIEVVQQKLQREGKAIDDEFATVVRDTPVRVNPRYGRWDPAQVQIAALPSGGLAKPEAGASPSPSGSPSGG